MALKLEKEVWVAELMENPVPDTSFVSASEDYSELVDNDTIHLQEAGVRPDVYKNRFAGVAGDQELPVQLINDTPHEKALDTYSTAQTRHTSLIDVELSYPKKAHVTNRHRESLAMNLGAVAAQEWAPAQANGFNNVLQLSASDSVIDAIVDLYHWYLAQDMAANTLNLCMSAPHLARIFKEDRKLFKEMFATPGQNYLNFKIWHYSKNPVYQAGVKQPQGTALSTGRQQSSFAWVSQEVFRAFGSAEMYAIEKHPGWQADLLSFAVRACAGPKRYNAPKYAAAILTTV